MSLFTTIKKIFTKEEKQPQQPPTYESVYYTSPLYEKSYQMPYNPDELTIRKGLDVYTKMLNDDQVKACLNIKKHAVLSTNWHIEPSSNDEEDKQIAEFCEFVLRDIEGVFEDVLFEMLSCLEYGFSVTEKIYYVIDYGKYKGLYGLKALKVKPPHGFLFHTDKFGNIIKVEQQTIDGIKEIPLNKIIILRNNPEFGNPYGTSDLRSAYRSWISKDYIIKAWNVYLERYSTIPILGKYKTNITREERKEMLKMLENLQTKSVAVIPEVVNIEPLEVRSTTADFKEAIEQHNKMIARALLVPDLLGYTSTIGGSYALGKKHFDVFLMVVYKIRRQIEEAINELLIKELCDFNFEIKDYNYPKFKFEPLDKETQKDLFELWIKAVQSGAVLPTIEDENKIREVVGLPKKEVSTEETELKEFVEVKLNREKTEYEKKVNFTEIVRETEQLVKKYATKISEVVELIREALITHILTKKIVSEKKVNEIDKIQLKYLGDLRDLFKLFIIDNFKFGQKQAKNEIKKEYKNINDVVLSIGAKPKKALEFFENYAFYMTGVTRDYILKEVKQELYNAIEKGLSEQEVVHRIQKVFDEFSYEGEQSEPYRINTMLWTVSNKAFNQGRLGVYLEADVCTALQYSAILDDRTTEFCRKYDGKIFLKTDPIWNKITPPNHFNCRSIIVPVLKWEDYELSEPLSIEPQEGFYSENYIKQEGKEECPV